MSLDWRPPLEASGRSPSEQLGPRRLRDSTTAVRDTSVRAEHPPLRRASAPHRGGGFRVLESREESREEFIVSKSNLIKYGRGDLKPSNYKYVY